MTKQSPAATATDLTTPRLQQTGRPSEAESVEPRVFAGLLLPETTPLARLIVRSASQYPSDYVMPIRSAIIAASRDGALLPAASPLVAMLSISVRSGSEARFAGAAHRARQLAHRLNRIADAIEEESLPDKRRLELVRVVDQACAELWRGDDHMALRPLVTMKLVDAVRWVATLRIPELLDRLLSDTAHRTPFQELFGFMLTNKGCITSIVSTTFAGWDHRLAAVDAALFDAAVALWQRRKGGRGGRPPRGASIKGQAIWSSLAKLLKDGNIEALNSRSLKARFDRRQSAVREDRWLSRYRNSLWNILSALLAQGAQRTVPADEIESLWQQLRRPSRR